MSNFDSQINLGNLSGKPALSSVKDWLHSLFGYKASDISCDQNTGPFTEVSQPSLDKKDVQEKLKQYYDICLKPEYKKGYLSSAANDNSESQTYALWQAYWAGDKSTFDSVLNWTTANLKRRDDNLISWKFQIEHHSPLLFWQRPYFSNYSVKILDSNSATDADTNMAYVLFKAGTDWKKQSYIDLAKKMVVDIWNEETVSLQDKHYAIAGNWANLPDRLIINPSYFSPQAYRTFAVYDGTHEWTQLIGDTYDLLAQVSDHGPSQPAVPPNWIQINKQDLTISNYPEKSDSLDYSFDAFRTLWFVSLDQLATPSFKSWNYVSAIKSFESDWTKNQQLCALYLYQGGTYVCDQSTTSTLAAPIGIFSVTNGYAAGQLVQKYYIHDGKLEFPDTEFYAKSWHWFAAWLWSHS